MGVSTEFKIEKIAIIGAGPGGLASLNEFLHTERNGASALTSLNKYNDFAKDPAFKDIVVFEQNEDIGGTWNYSKEADPYFPADTDRYFAPRTTRPIHDAPESSALSKATYNAPLIKPSSKKNLWPRSAVHDNLYTNVSGKYMRFTAFDPPATPEKDLYHPLLARDDVLGYIKKFAESYDLKKYVRFNTTVEKVVKNDETNKWVVTVFQTNRESGEESWYTEEFDAVVCAVGRFNVPYFPKIDGLPEFSKRNPDVVLHSKSFRNATGWEDKKVLIIGSGTSAVDILQYLIPLKSNLHVASRVDLTPKSEEAPENWLDNIWRKTSSEYIHHSPIKRFDGDKVEFLDGTIETGFDKIVFSTGYHIYYPFLDVPENEGKDYATSYSENNDYPDTQRSRVENLYLYSFTISDPTLAHVGLPVSPFFFLVAEACSCAVAGVWSNASSLPSPEDQESWIQGRLTSRTSKFQRFDLEEIRQFFAICKGLAPRGRVEVNEVIADFNIKEALLNNEKSFFKVASGEIKQSIAS